MSWTPCPDPTPGDRASAEAIELLIVPRAVDLGEMVVRRALPSVKRQMVGPFIFFDQMGPAEFLTDQGIDVRPHPHINLATVTFLFEGQILHRDSLGTEKTIEPGAVNWMRAGRGIVHSERTSPERKHSGQRLFGIQSWMALPEAQEESDPAFVRPWRRGTTDRPCGRHTGARHRRRGPRGTLAARHAVRNRLRPSEPSGRRTHADRALVRRTRRLHAERRDRDRRRHLRARPASRSETG
ncbi:pirin family protein [Micromonospora sp. STR1s_5]|nr:pirin family protein [Micromonospora sp. STR1s_5]